MMIELVACVAIGLYLVMQLVLMCSIAFTPDDVPENVLPEDQLPFISILVAARNEEKNIERCLAALDRLQYPRHKLQILLGNDRSDDRTRELAIAYIKDKPQFTIIDIETELGKARGKANVLANLAHAATGELYLITDADIAVNPYWAYELAQYFYDKKMGIVSGITIVDDAGISGKLQQIDWIFFMGMLQGYANLGLHCTAVGNNMAISKEAYWETGGYENIDFSVTEDYKLYKEVRQYGWKTANILSEGSINRSTAIGDFMSLMHQRKRWLKGALELPFYWWLFFGLFGLFTPAIAVLLFLNIKVALVLYMAKLVIQSTGIWILKRRMRVKSSTVYIALYELFTIAVSLSTQFFFLLPVKLKWKKRTYLL
jgi:cellulose synthase/poly-beta-1,6-N-acetylglucosamine synthase-like glycosyltransferase